MQTGALQTPVNQKRHTNVAVIRMKKAGHRFEIACYKNKVLSWRDGKEEDIDEVLQTHIVFRNVSKGVAAPLDEINDAFGTTDVEEVLLQILKKGELQVSEKERQARNEALFRDIANVVASLCVDPSTSRPVTLGIVGRAMKDAHVSVRPGYPAKQQALEVIKLLQENDVPISRAQMRLRLVIPSIIGKCIRDEKLMPLLVSIEEETLDEDMTVICLIDPGTFRSLEELIRRESSGHGIIEVLDSRVKVEGDLSIGESCKLFNPVLQPTKKGKKKGRRKGKKEIGGERAETKRERRAREEAELLVTVEDDDEVDACTNAFSALGDE